VQVDIAPYIHSSNWSVSLPFGSEMVDDCRARHLFTQLRDDLNISK